MVSRKIFYLKKFSKSNIQNHISNKKNCILPGEVLEVKNRESYFMFYFQNRCHFLVYLIFYSKYPDFLSGWKLLLFLYFFSWVFILLLDIHFSATSFIFSNVFIRNESFKNDCFYNLKTKVIFKMVNVMFAVLGIIITLIIQYLQREN